MKLKYFGIGLGYLFGYFVKRTEIAKKGVVYFITVFNEICEQGISAMTNIKTKKLTNLKMKDEVDVFVKNSSKFKRN